MHFLVAAEDEQVQAVQATSYARTVGMSYLGGCLLAATLGGLGLHVHSAHTHHCGCHGAELAVV